MAKSELTLLEIASDALLKDLRTALAVPVESLRSLADSLDHDRGFKIAAEEPLIKSWTTAGSSASSLLDTHNVLGHLFDHGISNEKSPDALINELRELCKAKGIPGFEERRDVLRLLLTPSEAYLERRAALPWSEKTLPNLVGFDCTAELRGAFRSSKSSDLLGLLPMVNLRLALKHDDDQKSQVRRFAMQLTEEDVDKLIETLNLAKQRLSVLRESTKGSHAKVYGDILRGQWKSD